MLMMNVNYHEETYFVFLYLIFVQYAADGSNFVIVTGPNMVR